MSSPTYRVAAQPQAQSNRVRPFQLPPNSPMLSSAFLYGVATSAFQIEGAAHDRLPCIWDSFCAQKGKIRDASNGDTACDHLTLWREDLALLNTLGVDSYRFSICWPRVIAEDGSLNKSGMDFYIQLVDALNAMGIKPHVTLYHWELPQHIEDEGGWLNRHTAYLYRDYVDQVTQTLGDKVYAYTTLNEPWCSAYLGYETGVHAPGLSGKDKGKKAAHHLLLAHGLAMPVIRKNAPASRAGIVLNFSPVYPASNAPEDIRASQLADDHFNHWYIKPVLQGQYPELLNTLPRAHQPDIHAGDLDIIAQPLDFLGVNYYTRAIYRAEGDQGFYQQQPRDAEFTAMGWEVYPQGLTDLLTRLHRDYCLPPVVITENGAATEDILQHGEVNDTQRWEYFQSHLLAVHHAMAQGVNIQGYFAWSLMDNFEWAEGYSKRFGLVYVDYATQSRTLKNSAWAYRALIHSRQ